MTEEPILLGLVAEQTLHGELLSVPLKQISQAQLVAFARNANELLPLIRNAPIHFAIVWCNRDFHRGLNNIRVLREAVPTLRIIAVGVEPERDALLKFLEAGVVGYLTRDEGLGPFRQMIADQCLGRPHLSANVLQSVIQRIGELQCRQSNSPAVGHPSLSKREIEILSWVARGQLNKQIAVRLAIRLPTVKNHVHQLLHKLGARTRREAVRLAAVYGILIPQAE